MSDESDESQQPVGPIRPIDDLPQPVVTPPSRGWVETPPPEAVYAALWASYREGAQVAKHLARRTGVSLLMADTAIRRGWPTKNWPALQERWRLFARQADAAREKELERDRAAAEDAGKTSATRWREYQEKWMPVAEMAPELVGELGRKLRTAVGAATFIRYRRVRSLDKDRNVVEVDQAYVDGSAVIHATALWCKCFQTAPMAMRYLLGNGALAPEPEAPELTAEQLEQLARGELPPGVTEQMLGAMLMRGGMNPGGT